jgi:hypothetical protein
MILFVRLVEYIYHHFFSEAVVSIVDCIRNYKSWNHYFDAPYESADFILPPASSLTRFFLDMYTFMYFLVLS